MVVRVRHVPKANELVAQRSDDVPGTDIGQQPLEATNVLRLRVHTILALGLARPSQSSARPYAFALNPPAHSALGS